MDKQWSLDELYISFVSETFLNDFEAIYLLSSITDEDKELKTLLKKDLKDKKKIVFIAADADNYEKTDIYCNLGKKYFKKLGITEFEKIDYRTTKFATIKHLETADIIFLNGGNPIKQMEFIKEYEIDSLINNFRGIFIGISAGAMNLAKKVYCSKDEDIPETIIYEGLGIIDITIEPHFDKNNKEQVKEFLKADLEVIGLPDKSFIKIDKYGVKNIYGTYYIKENEKIVKKEEN